MVGTPTDDHASGLSAHVRQAGSALRTAAAKPGVHSAPRCACLPRPHPSHRANRRGNPGGAVSVDSPAGLEGRDESTTAPAMFAPMQLGDVTPTRPAVPRRSIMPAQKGRGAFHRAKRQPLGNGTVRAPGNRPGQGSAETRRQSGSWRYPRSGGRDAPPETRRYLAHYLSMGVALTGSARTPLGPRPSGRPRAGEVLASGLVVAVTQRVS